MYGLVDEKTKQKWKGSPASGKKCNASKNLLLNIYIQSWPGLMQIVFMDLHILEF